MPETSSETPNLHLTKAQTWQAVKLPLRLRILETTRRLGETSVTELAQAVGLNRTALYFHLRLLERSGLLVSRAGEPTPGRRGKRPRYYRANVGELAFPIDGDGKRGQQRAVDLLRPWFAESRSALLDPKSAGGMVGKRIALHWEAFTDDEVSRIRAVLGELEDVVRRARNRANSTRKAPAATHHLVVAFTPVEGHVMPGPDMRFKK